MRLTQIDELKITTKQIDQLLFEGLDYTGECADAILVLGCRVAYERRVPEAAEVYHQGKAGVMVLSGGKAQDSAYGFMPECESMLRSALEHQVPQSAILLEDRSMITIENFTFSQEILEQHCPDCKKIILVTSAYHMRRSMLLAQKILPQYEFIPCPAKDPTADRETWQADPECTRVIYNELRLLKRYAGEGIIADEDFSI